ncbi:MAG: toxin-antitoxin system HicB family antitoxin [Ruminococcus sp.]|nr:toxin-antitoxin system HicB family antitoxin [Ruminococcus sp.]
MFKIQKGYGSHVTKSFRLPEELVEKLDKLAFENNISLNQLVIQCLNYALDDMEESDKQE